MQGIYFFVKCSFYEEIERKLVGFAISYQILNLQLATLI